MTSEMLNPVGCSYYVILTNTAEEIFGKFREDLSTVGFKSYPIEIWPQLLVIHVAVHYTTNVKCCFGLADVCIFPVLY